MSTHQRRQINLVEIPNVKTCLGERSVLYQGDITVHYQEVVDDMWAIWSVILAPALGCGRRGGGGVGQHVAVRIACTVHRHITDYINEVADDMQPTAL